MSVACIVLIRHGETTWSVEGRMASRSDISLTDAGRQEARLLGTALARTPHQLVSSPAQRSIDTAEIVRRTAGSPNVRVDDRLRELDFGALEGKRTRELGDDYRRWRDGIDDTAPLGERSDDACARAVSFFADARNADASTVVAVTHSHIARILITACVLDLPARAHRRLRLDTGHAAVLGADDGAWRLVGLNVSAHDLRHCVARALQRSLPTLNSSEPEVLLEGSDVPL